MLTVPHSFTNCLRDALPTQSRERSGPRGLAGRGTGPGAVIVSRASVSEMITCSLLSLSSSSLDSRSDSWEGLLVRVYGRETEFWFVEGEQK